MIFGGGVFTYMPEKFKYCIRIESDGSNDDLVLHGGYRTSQEITS